MKAAQSDMSPAFIFSSALGEEYNISLMIIN
ncbi:MAG: hypothetical protein MEPRV_02024 [Providencia sp.]